MLIHRIDKFLTNGSGNLPPGDWKAIALHPSSEVDLVDVGGFVLSPAAIVPLSRDPKLKPIRNAPIAIETGIVYDVLLDAGSSLGVGQALIVQLYEACDALVPPPALAPLYRQITVPAAAIPVAIGTSANLVMRVPMTGRRRCRISFRRTTAVDLQLLTVAVNWGIRSVGPLTSGAGVLSLGGHVKENTIQTWFDGGALPSATGGNLAVVGPQYQVRSINIGGDGDAAETMDELLVFIAGAAGGDAEISAEAR